MNKELINKSCDEAIVLFTDMKIKALEIMAKGNGYMDFFLPSVSLGKFIVEIDQVTKVIESRKR